MQWIETTGRTLDEAKDAALDKLGVDSSDAEFEVVEEPRGGILGRFLGEARVRARVRPAKPPPKDEGPRRGRRNKRGNGGNGDKGGKRRQKNEQRSTNGKQDGQEAAGSDRGGKSTGQTQQQEPKKRRRRRRRSSNKSPAEAGSADRTPRGEGANMTTDVPIEEQGETAREFLDGLLDHVADGIEVRTTVLDEETVEVAATAPEDVDLGYLIGPRGETLNAVQELARTVVQRQTGARNGRVVVDVAEYRAKRREALGRFARKVIDEVKESGERRVLEPMHPADRKVVHDVANEDGEVRTTSEGEEPRRRVVILPAE